MEIWGLCPGCRTWFRCFDSADRRATLPACPDCSHTPVQLEYREGGLSLVEDLAEALSDVWIG
jgi:hypothetical protein